MKPLLFIIILLLVTGCCKCYKDSPVLPDVPDAPQDYSN